MSTASTTVISIETVGNAKVAVVDPVKVGGVLVTNVTLNDKVKIKAGDAVTIELRDGIIPEITYSFNFDLVVDSLLELVKKGKSND